MKRLLLSTSLKRLVAKIYSGMAEQISVVSAQIDSNLASYIVSVKKRTILVCKYDRGTYLKPIYLNAMYLH